MQFPLCFYTTPSIISIMSIPFKLYRLQELDNQLNQATKNIQIIKARLADNQELQKAQNELDRSNENLNTVQKKLKDAEDRVKDQKIKIEQIESSLYGGRIRNPKELQDLDSELISLRKYLSILEDRLLEVMISMDDSKDIFNKAQQRYSEVFISYNEETEQLKQEQLLLLSDLDRLTKERDVSTNSIPKNQLDLYTKLLQKKQGYAVTKVVDKTCSSCGTTLSASTLQSANMLNQVTFCDNCGRILYGGK